MVVVLLPNSNLLWTKVAAAVTIAGVTAYLVTPLARSVLQPALNYISDLAPQSEWCKLPYGVNVLVPAYLSFSEPVVACFLAAALAWSGFSAARTGRYLQFSLLILAVKSQLITPFVYAAFAKTSVSSALASEGQFALEALVLALVTAISWNWVRTDKASG